MKIAPMSSWKSALVNGLRQFKNLDTRDPASWPNWPRAALLVLVALLVLAGLWFAWLSGYHTEYNDAVAKEEQLRQEFSKKAAEAASLELLKKQREQVQQYVTRMEKQLPNKSEMDALLSDITTAGRGRGLQFEHFRPGSAEVKEYYAVLPIAIRVTGKYHEMATFAADIAQLSRIVTLNNLSIASGGKDGNTLVMDGTARTFRYLDTEETAAQNKAKAAKK